MNLKLYSLTKTKHMKNFIFVLIITTTLNYSYSQDFNFGKVSKEEIQEKFNPLDSSAPATILYREHKVYFNYVNEKGFEVVTEIQERVKIYNQKGFKYATEQILLYKSGSEKEKASKIKGVTYNVIDGKIVEDKLDKDAIFDNEYSKYRDEVKFTMPNIKEGTVIEYSYTIYSPFYNIDEIPLQFDIPVKKVNASVQIPEYFEYALKTKGYLAFIPKKSKKSGSINFMNRHKSGGHGLQVGSTSYSTSKVDYITNITTIDLDNVPALKEEKFVNNINNYRSGIKYELAYIKFPNSFAETFTTSWESVAKNIYEYEGFGGELSKTGYFESDIDELIAGSNDNMERAAIIFDYVKSKMNWNNYNGVFCDEGVRKAYKENVGNIADINLMLTSMLRYAGINANPVLVSTRSHGISLFPTREGFNYVISAIEVENNVILLDATEKFTYPDILPERALNWYGRLIRKDGSSLQINLMPTNISRQMVSISFSLDEKGTIEGKLRKQLTDNNALLYRKNFYGVNEDDYLEKLENSLGGIVIKDFELLNQQKISEPIIESFGFSKENAIDVIGDKIYFTPMLFMASNENPFKLEKRDYPVDFSYPKSNRYMINVQIPDGYKIEYLPENAALGLPDNLGMFKYNVASIGNNIQIIVSHEINSAIISPIYYGALKEFYNQLVQKETEKIVLTKV